MPITFAAAVSHVPGMTAWADAAPVAQKDRIYGAFDKLRRELDASGTDTLIALTSEHWTNFFLDHIGAFCIGRAERYSGPVEPWLKVEKAELKGDPQLAAEILEAAYDSGFEPGFAYELEFDHGTMVPLHFLAPRMDRPVVPVLFNTLASPQPAARRCLEFGRVIGRVAARSRQAHRADRDRRPLARSRREEPRRRSIPSSITASSPPWRRAMPSGLRAIPAPSSPRPAPARSSC